MDLGILQQAGAAPKHPVHWYPLTIQKFFSGFWTQRSPFSNPAGRYDSRFLGGRSDILCGGANVEITNWGTLIRRPGILPYCTATLPTPIQGFYSFKQINGAANPIVVIADTATGVYSISPTTVVPILIKARGAGQAYFQGVGNNLYIGDGVDLLAWSEQTGVRNWGISIGSYNGSASVNPSGGGAIIGTSGPLLPISGSDVAVTNGQPWSNPANITQADNVYATTTISATGAETTPATFGQAASQSGSSYSWLNTNNILADTGSYASVSLPVPPGNTASNSISATNLGLNIPADATITGITVSLKRYEGAGTSAVFGEVSLAGVPGSTAKSDGPYSSSSQLVTFGSGSDLWGASITPAMVNSSAFGVSIYCQCTGAPGNGNTANVSAVKVTVAYSVPKTTISDYLEGTSFGFNLSQQQQILGIAVQVTGYQPAGNPASSSLTVGLLNNGSPVGQAKVGLKLGTTNGAISLGTSQDLWGTTWTANSVNSSGFGIYLQANNASSSADATWYIDCVKITLYVTGGLSISTTGSGSFTVNKGLSYAVAYGNSNSGHVSTSSVVSQIGSFSNAAGVNISLQASPDPQVNQIWVFRTKDGGSILYNLPTSPYPNTTTTVTDSAADAALLITQQAPISDANNPPPAALTKMTYHVGRVWGVVGNTVYYSAGPDCLLGNGSEAWPPANFFIFPTQVNRLVPTSTGLLVITQDDIWIISGTSTATFYPAIFQQGLGILSYNAFDSLGSNYFMYTSDRQFVTVTSAGISELGFAIGDQLETYYDPTKAYVAALINGTRDKAVFLGDGSEDWYRCNWNQPPEGGPAWSPQATITGGATALANIEVAPGIRQLLIGQSNGTVAYRSYDVFTDNGSTYSAWFELGSLVLAQPGQLAEVQSITLELPKIGSVPTLSVLFDEITGSYEPLTNYVDDPPMLAPSNSLWSLRFYVDQGQNPVVCRHMKTRVQFADEPFRNEIYTHSIWGQLLAQE